VDEREKLEKRKEMSSTPRELHFSPNINIHTRWERDREVN
jgi:hypothetical protein